VRTQRRNPEQSWHSSKPYSDGRDNSSGKPSRLSFSSNQKVEPQSTPNLIFYMHAAYMGVFARLIKILQAKAIHNHQYTKEFILHTTHYLKSAKASASDK
jgi:hypothetical protein